MCILKIFTENLFVEYPESDRFEKSLLVKFEGTPDVKIFDQVHVDVVSKHLRSEYTGIELGVMSHNRLGSGTDKLHEIQKDFCERSSFAFGILFGDTMNLDRSFTNRETIRNDDGVERIEETTPMGKSGGR
jgi:hypothetical protein